MLSEKKKRAEVEDAAGRVAAAGYFAELEWQAQGIRLEPLLGQLSEFLDQHGELLELVAGDLRRGLKCPDTGRQGLSALQVLRCFICSGSRTGICASCASAWPMA